MEATAQTLRLVRVSRLETVVVAVVVYEVKSPIEQQQLQMTRVKAITIAVIDPFKGENPFVGP